MTARFQAGAWRKSSYSNGGASECVEVAAARDGRVGVRDTKLGPASPVLVVPSLSWHHFLAATRGPAPS